MSGKICGLVYGKRMGSTARKSVLARCAELADDQGCGIWASKGNIAADVELGRSTVFRAMKELVEEGLLVITGLRRGRNGPTVAYDLDLDKLAALPSSRSEAPPVQPRNPSRSGTSFGVHQDQSKSGTSPTEKELPSHSGTQTVLEPSYGGGGCAGSRGAGQTGELGAAVPSRPIGSPDLAMRFRERILDAMSVDPVSGRSEVTSRILGSRADMQVAALWEANGLTQDEIMAAIGEVMVCKKDGPPMSFRYFDKAMRRHLDNKVRGSLPKPSKRSASLADHAPTALTAPTHELEAVFAELLAKRHLEEPSP